MAAILFVRVSSMLDSDELIHRVSERLPLFGKVPGLIQKVYGRDEETGDVCGIFLFENMEALITYRNSELAKSAADVYEALEVRPEVFDLLFLLSPEKGLSME